MNIYEIEKLTIVLHLLQGTPDGIFKTDVFRRRDGCRFQQNQIVVAVSRFLQQVTGIVAHHLRKHIWSKPCANHCMSLKHQDNRKYTDFFKARCNQQTCIQTGSHFIRQHLVSQTDALSCLFKTGWRSGIDDAFRTQGFINSSNLSAYPISVLCLVLIKSCRTCPFLQELGSR